MNQEEYQKRQEKIAELGVKRGDLLDDITKSWSQEAVSQVASNDGLNISEFVAELVQTAFHAGELFEERRRKEMESL